jgi:hypothetical protein
MRESFYSDPGLTKHPTPRAAPRVYVDPPKKDISQSWRKRDLAFVRGGFTNNILYEGKFLREESRNVKIKKR